MGRFDSLVAQVAEQAARITDLEEALGALLDAQSKPKSKKADQAKEPK
jgi:hypothetical protein